MPFHGTLRVVLTGAESTGKTTLARQLARQYDAEWLPEYVRGFVVAQGRLPALADVDAIATGHLAAERTALQGQPDLIIMDTDLVSTCIYSEHYFGTCPGWVREAARDRHADLYLLAGADIPYESEPAQRDSAEVRTLLQRRFEAELRARGLRVVRLRGGVSERLATATKAIDALLDARR